ncbi:MAG: CoA-binding protein [Chitinophagaceae bacterium]|nr:CoA-binding protein [Chitinophagaceae bacterium]
MNEKTTLVLGASDNPARYSNMAINRLRKNNHPVVAIGKKTGVVADTPVETQTRPIKDIDTVTLYLNPTNQKQYYDYIIGLHPKRIIFNPGAENAELAELAKEKGIEPIEACTLVMLSTGQY